MDIIKNDKKTVRGWAMFDWANSVFTLVVATAVFPPFFSSLAPDTMSLFGMAIDSNALYSFSISFSYLFVAVASPLLSGIADFSGRRLFFLKVFTILGSLACLLLYFFNSSETAWLGLIGFVIGNIGFAGCIVFYNAYLPDIVTEDQFDKVSAQGYAYGYVGSTLLLIVILALIQFKGHLGIESDILPVQISFLLVGTWWLGFGFMTFSVLPKDSEIPFKMSSVTKGYGEMRSVLKKVLKKSGVTRFLISFFFYIAGVNVVIYLASVFAEAELGFGQSELILLIIMLQFLAAIGSYFFAYLSGFIGNKYSLMIQVLIWIGICCTAYFVDGKPAFYVLSGFVGLVFGGIQSLSRSTYSKLLDDDIDGLTSYYSFYDVLYKVAVVAGTFVWGLVSQLTGNMRYSILSVAVFFILGMIFLASAKIEEAET